MEGWLAATKVVLSQGDEVWIAEEKVPLEIEKVIKRQEVTETDMERGRFLEILQKCA